jgi:phosphoribosylformylglycinamidine cyclo-ligase
MATYREAGVDQETNDRFVDRISKLARVLNDDGVIGGIGSFAGMMAIGGLGYREPVLVAGTDGVGSKLELAFALDQHHTVGIDLVAMSVNDVICHGAKPLFFLDYMGLGRLDLDQGVAIVSGIVEGCRRAGCALLGGETAQLPTFYRDGRYELAGFALGIAEKERLITGAGIVPGDAVVGLPSSGCHSNGFSFIRKIIADNGLDLTERYEENRTLGETLLTPTRIYVAEVLRALAAGVTVKGIAHITGGGIPGNFARVLPSNVGARIERGRWREPSIFASLQRWGHVADDEMFAVFNMGLGMLLVVPAAEATQAAALLGDGVVVGECTAGEGVTIV